MNTPYVRNRYAKVGSHLAAQIAHYSGSRVPLTFDPQAWLADVLGQIADIPQGRLAELLPWNWKQPNLRAAA